MTIRTVKQLHRSHSPTDMHQSYTADPTSPAAADESKLKAAPPLHLGVNIRWRKRCVTSSIVMSQFG